jgi:hypothetical protein
MNGSTVIDITRDKMTFCPVEGNGDLPARTDLRTWQNLLRRIN